MTSTAGGERLRVGALLVFLASAAATVALCRSMSSMPGMPMPGGWTMSMAWMRMPDATWAETAASFLGMWLVMMVAMMLPSLLPMLGLDRADRRLPRDVRDERPGCRRDRRRRAMLTLAVAAGYFSVWTALGAIAFGGGIAAAALEMRHESVARAVPVGVALVVVLAGALQLTDWKARQLACCRPSTIGREAFGATAAAAWRHGVTLGLRCGRCCAGLMATLLVLGVMDLRAMAAVTVAITAERLAPAGRLVARAVGVVLVLGGLALLSRAAG